MTVPNHEEVLRGKRVLAVDDEPDILETLKDRLEECTVDTAVSFQSAHDLLDRNSYDAVILDLMGVNGFELLRIAALKQIPTLVLTAHGLQPEHFVASIKLGAKSYVPKDELYNIDAFLAEIFQASERGIACSGNWFVRLESFYERLFGRDWKEKDKAFWKEFETSFVTWDP